MVWRYGLDLPQDWDQRQAVLKSHTASCTMKVNELHKLSGTHDWTMSNIPCKMYNHLIWVMSNITLGKCYKSLWNYHVLFAKLYGIVKEQRYLNYTEINQYTGWTEKHSLISSIIKSKLTGIFLQNWWLQLHKLIQFHVVSHTLNVPPSCYSANINVINLAQTRFPAAYPAWPTWQLQWCVPAAHPRLQVVEVHRLSFTYPQRKKSQTVRSGDLFGKLLVKKCADSKMPVRWRPILLNKVVMSLSN